MHMHIPVLYKFAKVFTNYMENPILPPYLKKKTFLPPPSAPTLDWMIQVIKSNPPPFQNFVADVNKYFGIELPENKFFVRAHAGNNLSRYNPSPPPPPQNQTVAS